MTPRPLLPSQFRSHRTSELAFFYMNAKEQVLELCKDGLIYFGKILFPSAFYVESPEFHKEIVENLMDRSILQIMFQAPRGFGKSTLLLLFVLHHLFFDKGNKVILIQSKTRPLALDRLSTVKALLKSYLVSDLFETNINEDTSSTWREDKIQFKFYNIITGEHQEVMIRAIGTGMPARGMLVGDTRITLYLLDDPDDEDNCKTKEAMDDNLSKFLGNKEGVDPRNGRTIVIGTPIREGCIVDRLNGNFGWVTKVYDSIDETNKVSIWEQYRSYEWIMDKKREYEELGMRWKWYAEFRCQISGEEDRLFKNWKYWGGQLERNGDNSYLKITHRNKQELPIPDIIPVNVFLGIDPASSTKSTADYSVTFRIAYDGRNIYVLPYFRKRTTPLGHAEQIIETIKQDRPVRGHVESVAYQEMLRTYLRQRLNEEDLYLPGLELKINPRSEKSSRLERMQPYFATGRIWIMDNMPELEDEFNMYPRGKHDDLLDGLELSSKRLYPPDHTVETEGDENDYEKYFLRQSGTNTGWQRV